MDLHDLLSRLAVSLGIGLLVGLERGWQTRTAASGSRTAGIRTFALSGLLGGFVAALAQALGPGNGAGLLIGLCFAAFAGLITVFCREENKADGTFSATTAVAAILTFALGGYAVIGNMTAAAAAAVATAGLLAMREGLHGWVEKITWPELRSVLVLLAMSIIALPVVPNDPIGPFGGVNPREIWLIAIILAGVSFLGYVAVKYVRAEHGILLAAAAGGLVSSTAVTVTNARRAAAKEGSPRLLAAGAALATAVSCVRVVAIVAALQPQLLWLIAPALLAAACVAGGLAAAAAYWFDSTKRGHHVVEFRNPFSFWSVVGFAIFLGLIVVLGRAVGEHLGSAGAIIGAAAMGLADLDAITVSMSRLAPQLLTLESAAFAILAAVATNTLSKLAIGAVIGRGRFALDMAIVSVACFAAAGLALWMSLALIPRG